ncbi:hypothetical protein [Larkinella punicea]|uniref:hypothetical protein n=1 Tax=Larkinella punicea TaxID=2315727 RepID=UPI0014040AE3|nr:hypothetical protein [Larkinella punicea]
MAKTEKTGLPTGWAAVRSEPTKPPAIRFTTKYSARKESIRSNFANLYRLPVRE